MREVGPRVQLRGNRLRELGLRVHLTEVPRMTSAFVYTSRRGAAGVEPWCTPHEAMLRDLRLCRADSFQETAGRLLTRFQCDLMQRILPQMSCTRGPTPASRPCDVYTKAQLPQSTGRSCTRGAVSRSVTSRAYQLEHVRVSQSLPLAVSWALTAAEESAPGLSRQLSELAGEVKAEVLRLGTRPQ